MSDIVEVLEAYVATPENGVPLVLTRPEINVILDRIDS